MDQVCQCFAFPVGLPSFAMFWLQATKGCPSLWMVFPVHEGSRRYLMAPMGALRHDESLTPDKVPWIDGQVWPCGSENLVVFHWILLKIIFRNLWTIKGKWHATFQYGCLSLYQSHSRASSGCQKQLLQFVIYLVTFIAGLARIDQYSLVLRWISIHLLLTNLANSFCFLRNY